MQETTIALPDKQPPRPKERSVVLHMISIENHPVLSYK